MPGAPKHDSAATGVRLGRTAVLIIAEGIDMAEAVAMGSTVMVSGVEP